MTYNGKTVNSDSGYAAKYVSVLGTLWDVSGLWLMCWSSWKQWHHIWIIELSWTLYHVLFFLHTSSLTLTLAAGSQCSYSLLVNELKIFTSIQMCVGEAK